VIIDRSGRYEPQEIVDVPLTFDRTKFPDPPPKDKKGKGKAAAAPAPRLTEKGNGGAKVAPAPRLTEQNKGRPAAVAGAEGDAGSRMPKVKASDVFQQDGSAKTKIRPPIPQSATPSPAKRAKPDASGRDHTPATPPLTPTPPPADPIDAANTQDLEDYFQNVLDS
jgi:hypothetical protein